jgi:hypothetical protein
MIYGLFTIVGSYILYGTKFKIMLRKILNKTDHFLEIS